VRGDADSNFAMSTYFAFAVIMYILLLWATFMYVSYGLTPNLAHSFNRQTLG
jgi:hypothetical protein